MLKYDPAAFVARLADEDKITYASVPQGKPTLYGTCYGLLTQHYLGKPVSLHPRIKEFILSCQHPETGMFEGPEFSEAFFEGKTHDAEHILLHLLCTVLPVLQQYDLSPRYPLTEAHKFCDIGYLKSWLARRDWKAAWLEGNNILFVGQILVYLRDVEKIQTAAQALAYWFEWLDQEADPATGLWGTQGYCSPFHAMCGGYHQLLVYYYENHPVQHPEKLVDTVLALQHDDGGFSPRGGGGACEDVDAVDILVNLYKLHDYKRPQIRTALRKCLYHILALQNEDGGFPYKKNAPQSHMRIPDTMAPPNVSTMFATWFRVHTLALISEILTDEPVLHDTAFDFSRALSMGWHRQWDKKKHRLTLTDRMKETPYHLQKKARYYQHEAFTLLRKGKSKVNALLQ